MAKYTIYHKDGSKVCDVHDLTQTDSLMGECCVEVSLKSPTVISFALGDYVDYRGRRYYMAVTPSVQKQARVRSVGNAIVYDSVKMTSAAGYDMTRCEFRDVVLESQSSTYHTNFAARTFSFYCTSLIAFGDRLQANLNRLFTGDDAWKVYVRLSDGSNHLCNGRNASDASKAMGEKDVTVSIQDSTCWDALQHVKDDFDVNFIMTDKVSSGINNKAIVLGCNGSVIPYYFQYGKGNGIFKFERTTDDSQAVVTMLRAYGTETNMPTRYYNNVGINYYLDIEGNTSGNNGEAFYYLYDYADGTNGGNVYSTCFMTKMTDETTIAHLKEMLESEEAYIKADDVTWHKVTIAGGKASNADTKSSCEVNAFVGIAGTYFIVCIDPLAGSTDAACRAWISDMQTNGWDILYMEDGARKSKWPAAWKNTGTDALSSSINVRCLMLPGFGQQSLYSIVQSAYGASGYETLTSRINAAVKDAYGVTPSTFAQLTQYVTFSTDKDDPYLVATKAQALYGSMEGSKTFDGSDDTDEIYPSLEWLGDSNKVVASTSVEDDGTGSENEDGTPEIETFEITVRLSFNPANYITYGSDSFTVHMQDGMCGGRDFECIKVVAKSNDNYVLTLKRVEDTSLNLWFPYKDFNVKMGDEFVLTDLDMPDEYIEGTALQELLPQAIVTLFDNCDVRYKYSLTVDNIEMQRNRESAASGEAVYDTIKAGDEIWFGDPDLGINYDADTQAVTGSVLIDKLEIKEEDGKIPQYSITLVDEVSVGTLESMQKQIDNIMSGKTQIGGTSGLNGYTSSDLQNIIKALGDARYLKLTGGTISGNLGVAGNTVMNGNATVTGTLHVTKLTADTLEIMEARHISGKVISSAADARLTAVSVLSDGGGYKCWFAKKDEDGNTVNNMFVAGDYIYCEQFSVDDSHTYVKSKAYWRECIEAGSDDNGNYIVLSATAENETYSDEPSVDDVVIQLGNKSDTSRQACIVYSPVGSFVYDNQMYAAPYECQYIGIDSPEWPDPVNAKSPELTVVNANKISLTTGGTTKDITEVLGEGFNIYTVSWEATTYTDDDGEAHATSPVAAADVEPSSEWSESDYASHVGDYLVTTNGFAYRFVVVASTTDADVDTPLLAAVGDSSQTEAGTEVSANTYQWEVVTDELLIKLQAQVNNLKQRSGFVTEDSYASMWSGVYDESAGGWLTTGYVTTGTFFDTILNHWMSTITISASNITIDADHQLIVDAPNFSLNAEGDVRVYGELDVKSMQQKFLDITVLYDDQDHQSKASIDDISELKTGTFYDYDGNVVDTNGYYNLKCTGLNIYMPTDPSYIGQRIVLYDDNTDCIGGTPTATIVTINDANSDGSSTSNKTFVGIGYYDRTSSSTPTSLFYYKLIRSITFVNGVIELLGVPNSNGDCTWAVLNIGTKCAYATDTALNNHWIIL